MTRNLCRVVRVDDISPIRKADLLELARVGGWRAVVKKDVFKVGDLGVYCEIDSFLPAGNPAWQFLVDHKPTIKDEVVGHALRTATLRGQLSQGLLLPLSAFDNLGQVHVGQDVTQQLGVSKYEKELSPDMLEKALGYYPTAVPRSYQPRIQNLSEELVEWRARSRDGQLTWEVSEKLEGESTSFIWMHDGLHCCSHSLDYMESSGLPMWHMARKLDLEAKLRTLGLSLALQGEMVGPGFAGNHYGLTHHAFYLYNVYDFKDGRLWAPLERQRLARELAIHHVPVVDAVHVLGADCTVDSLLEAADFSSEIVSVKRREGLVFKAHEEDLSFKVISNKYLLNAPL